MLPFRCADANSPGLAGVEHLRPDLLKIENVLERHRAQALERLIERHVFLAVEHGVVREVRGGFRLIGGHDLDERFLAHRLERVVRAALLPQRGYGFLAERFPAQRARAVCGIDQALIGQRKQFPVQRIEEHAAQVVCGPPQRRAQVGTAHVADE